MTSGFDPQEIINKQHKWYLDNHQKQSEPENDTRLLRSFSWLKPLSDLPVGQA